jgi:hypothetical protein
MILQSVLWPSGNPRILITEGDGSPSNPHAIPETTSSVSIDGILDDAAWNNALKIDLRYEVEPGENIEPPEPTECLITYNDNFLLVGFRCFDSNADKIRANYSDRDQIMSDDRVMIQLDTFNDERRAFVFASNPLGVQWDVVHVSSRWDNSWDAIWDCAGKIFEWGYAVEFAIPFDQLRFRKTGQSQVWGFDANRVLPRSLEHVIAAFPRDRSNNCYHCQMIKIEGFEQATPGRNIELAPTLTGVRTDARDAIPHGHFLKQNQEAEFGLTAKWGITSNFFLQGTINPDFSQVEADALQLDINQPFALFYREKRPFFTEGSDYFETLANRHIEGMLNPVYTRTIRDPQWGTKLTGKQGGHTFGAFFVRDAITNIIFPGHELSSSASLSESSSSSVFRYRGDIGNKYSFGTLFTNRQGGGYFNRVYGIDGDVRFSDRDRLVFQVLGSTSKYPGNLALEYGQKQDNFSDYLWMAHYRHHTRNYRFYADYHSIGRGFRADLGYVPRVGYSKAEVGLGYTWWGEGTDFLNRMVFDINYDQTHQQGGSLMEREIELTSALHGPWKSMVFLYYGARKRVYEELRFNQEFKGIGLSMQPSGRLSLGSWIAFEDKIDYSHGRPASEFFINSHALVNLNRNLHFSLNHSYITLDVNDGRLFRANTLDVSFLLQFNRRIFFRAILQVTDLNQNQNLYAFNIEEESTSLFSQLLFSYKLNPRTVVFLGYSDNYFDTADFNILQTDRTFFVKFGYAWTL